MYAHPFRSFIVIAVSLILCTVSVAKARQTPMQHTAVGASAHSQHRALMADNKAHRAESGSKSTAHSKRVQTAQISNNAGGPPPFLSAAVPRGPAQQVHVPAAPHAKDVARGAFDGGFDGGFNGDFDGGFRTNPNWIGVAGVTANVATYGVGVTTAFAAPIVNGLASNIPLMAPTLPDGSCLRGRPIFLPRLNAVMCIVGNGAQVTNAIFRGTNALVRAAAGSVGIAAQIASVAAGK